MSAKPQAKSKSISLAAQATKLEAEAMSTIIDAGFEGEAADQILAEAWAGSDAATILKNMDYESAMNAVQFALVNAFEGEEDAIEGNADPRQFGSGNEDDGMETEDEPSTHNPPSWLADDKRRKAFWQSAHNLAKSKGIADAKKQDAWIHASLEVEHLEELDVSVSDSECLAILKKSDAPEQEKPQPHKGNAIEEFNKPTPTEIEMFEGELNQLLKGKFQSAGTLESRQRLMSSAWDGIDNIPDALAKWTHNEAWHRIVSAVNAKVKQVNKNGNGPVQQELPNGAPDQPQRALATITNNALIGQMDARLSGMMAWAQVMIDSGLMPKNITKPTQLVVIMEMGRALDIPDITAVSMINVVNGKPSVSPALMIAQVERKGLMEDMQIEDDGETCTCMVKRKGRSPFVATFSMDDAKKLGLAGKDNWNKQPKVMRQWRAIAAAFRVVFPDVLLGVASYTTEELDPDVVIEEVE